VPVATIEDVPVIDLEVYMKSKDGAADPQILAMCKQVAECLNKYGILIVRDPRAKEEDNDDYIDLMERYFESRGKILYAGGALEDARPECHYQVGVCPEGQEIARDHAERVLAYTPENKPASPIVPIPDAKWRFMWKIGERPKNAADNFPQVVPKDFEDWEAKMDKWGYKLIDAVR